MKLSTIIWMMVVVVASFMLYKVKYQVQDIKAEIASATRALEREREALHVVAAEWAYLNRPARLQELASKYLASTDLTVNQIAEVQEIPFPNRSVASAEGESAIKPVSLRMAKSGGR